jgi:DNA-binding MarR family transcriptional regulator
METDLNEKFALLQYLLRKRQMKKMADVSPLADTGRGQGRIIALLKVQDGMSVKDMSFLLGLAMSSLSELLAKLEKGGYITKEASELDKRMTIVRLTEKGKQEPQKDGGECDSIFECLNSQEQTAFSEFLDRLIAVLKTELGYDDEEIALRTEKLISHFHGIYGCGHHHGIRERIARHMVRGGLGHSHKCGINPPYS